MNDETMKHVGFRMTKRWTMMALALLMSVGMWAQSGTEASAKAALLRDQADSLYSLQKYDEAKALALKGLGTLDEGRHAVDVSDADGETRGDLLNLLSIINVRQGHFEQAAEYAKQCNELDLKRGDADMISSSYNTLAAIYMSMRQPKEAEKYILKALSYAQKVDNPQRMAVLNGMASEVYHHLGQDEQSLDYATRAYDMERDLGRKDKMAIRQAQRAAALISLKRSAEAEKALGEAIPGLRESGNRHSLGIACNQMGLLKHQQQNDSAAVRYYNEALEIFLDQKDLYNESFSRKGLYDALKTIDPALALQHNDRYLALRDSLYDSETGVLLSKYAAEYNNYELQAENEEMQRARSRNIIIGVVVLTLIFLCWLLNYLWMRRRQRLQQQVNAQLQQSLDKLMEENKRLNHQDEETVSEESREFQLKIIGIVNEQMEKGEVSVDALASELCLSTTQLRSRINELTGETPQNYVLGIRMQKARHLMAAHPSMAMGTIALRCGYEEKASFSRAFKRYFGMSPTDFLKSDKQNPSENGTL
jgi:AraC-like DNA-binding protein